MEKLRIILQNNGLYREIGQFDKILSLTLLIIIYYDLDLSKW